MRCEGLMQGRGVIPCLWAGKREVNMAVPPPGPATWGPGRGSLRTKGNDTNNNSRPRTRGGTMGLRLGIGKFYNLQGDRPLETGQEMLGPRGGGSAGPLRDSLLRFPTR